MKKIIPIYDGVVIGSRTLPEFRFQVINFLNMLWDNIINPDSNTCMTPNVVRNNLMFEIKRLVEKDKTLPNNNLTSYEKKIDFIRNNIRQTQDVKVIYDILLSELITDLKLENSIQKINENN